MDKLSEKKIGVLILENNPFGELYGTDKLEVKGSLGNPQTFNYPVIYEKVPGATGDTVVYAGESIINSYISSAIRLVEKGASMITANCGFTILFQKDLADSVSVPVVTSSLVLLPFVSNLISSHGEIGILTYDSDSLRNNILASNKVAIPDSKVVFKGFQNFSSWAELNKANPVVNAENMKEDLLKGCREILKQNPKIEVLILECTGMPRFRSDVRSIVKIPVFDIVDAVHFVSASLQ